MDRLGFVWSASTVLGLGAAVDVDGSYAALNRRIFAVDPVPPCIPAVSAWGVLLLLLGIISLASLLLRTKNAGAATVIVAAITTSHLGIASPLDVPRREDRLLVRFHANVPEADQDNCLQAAGGQLLVRDPHVPNLTVVEVNPAHLPIVFGQLTDNPNVMYVEPDYLLELAISPDDPSFQSGNQWGITSVRLPHAWDTWTGELAPDFRIAVIDNGVDYEHPDLAANMWTNPNESAGDANGDGCPGICGIDDDGDGIVDENPTHIPVGSNWFEDDDENGYVDDLHGYDFGGTEPLELFDADPRPDVMGPLGGHGTHVAGIVGALTNNATGVAGVNWRCKLVALKIFRPSNTSSVSDAINAMTYVINNGILVSNNSWRVETEDGFAQALYNKIQESQAIGHIFVTSAGNQGLDVDVNPVYPGAYDLPNIINVTSIDNLDRLYSSIRNYGVVGVDLAAPGEGIWSTWWSLGPPPVHTYLAGDGASAAAPYVTGVVSLVWGQNPGLTWQKVKKRILDRARPVPSLQYKTVTGGVLDAAGAVLDCNLNGIPDNIDIGPGGGSDDCDVNKVPDECQFDCDENGVPDVCEMTPGACCLSETECVPDLTECLCETYYLGVFAGPASTFTYSTCWILPDGPDPGELQRESRSSRRRSGYVAVASDSTGVFPPG